MYSLYFESNNQAHNITLTERPSVYFSKILTVNSEGYSEIIRFHKNTRLISSIRSFEDKDVFLTEIRVNGNDVEFTFSEKGNSLMSQGKLESNDLLIEFNKTKEYIIVYNKNADIKSVIKYNVTVKYSHVGTDYLGKITLYCASPHHIYDVVLDFGSEASQMLIKRRNEDSAIRPQKLFDNTLGHFWNKSVSGNRVFDQQDNDSTLFRSVFYRKGQLTLPDDFESSIPSPKDPFFNFISKRTEAHGDRIPNVKISYLSGWGLDGIDNVRLNVGIIMRFVHEALEEISQTIIGSGVKNTPIAVNFILLLPNVMPQLSVSQILSKIEQIANSDNFLAPYKGRADINVVAVNGCSESDASFLNWMREGKLPQIHKGDRCLTIDVGKGTTDFSIVRILDSKHAVSEFRSGFVGAGNAISYAVFKNYINAIVGPEKVDEAIIKVLDGEPAMLYELDNVIEDKKHNWKNVEIPTPVSKIPSVQSATVEFFIDKIRDLNDIGDPNNIVGDMLQSIAENIVTRLPKPPVNFIIFSGRAFRFKRLQEVLRTCLDTAYGSKQKYLYNDSDTKSGCLFGASSDIQLSLSSKMIGLPIISDISNIKSEQRAFQNSTNNSKNTTTSNLKKIGEEILSWIKNESDGIYFDSSDVSTSQDEVKQIMQKGKEYNQIDANSVFRISGRFYSPEDNYQIKKEDKPYSIFFDGESFLLRHSMGSHRLSPNTIQAEQKLVFESQFPYSMKIKDINKDF